MVNNTYKHGKTYILLLIENYKLRWGEGKKKKGCDVIYFTIER